MKEKEVWKEVSELINKLDPIPLSASHGSLKELLAFLRVKIVYTVFDLEATRRELRGRQ